MKIFCATQLLSDMPTSKLVNVLGRYLYAHISGTFRYTKTSNSYEIYISTIQQDTANESKPHQFIVSLNLTTYQNKIRVEVIAHTPKEETLGFAVFQPDSFDDLDDARISILKAVNKMLYKAYSNTVTIM